MNRNKISLGLICVILFCSIVVNFHLIDTVKEEREKTAQQIEYRRSDVIRYSTSWESCLSNLEIDADVVFLGDSLTMHHNFQQDFPNIKIVNLGVAGDTVDNLVSNPDRIQTVAAVNPEKVFIMAGVNDMTGTSINGIIEQYDKLLKDISIILPDSELFVQTVLPVRNTAFEERYAPSNDMINDFNSKLEEICGGGVFCVDLNPLYKDGNGELNYDYSEDGLHITEESYQIWINAIKPYLDMK